MKKIIKENLAALREKAGNIWCDVKEKRHDVCTLLIIGYFILYTMPDYMSTLNATICNALCLLFALIVFFLQWDRQFTHIEIKEIAFYALVWIMHISAIAYNGNISLTSMVHVLKHFFLAAGIVRTKLNRKLVQGGYWIVFEFFAAFMLVGIGPGFVPHTVSQNAIGMHILLFAALYMLAETDKKSLQLKLVMLSAMVICVWTGSRTSLIAVVVMLAGLFVQHLPEVSIKELLGKITKKDWMIIGTVGAVAVAVIIALNVISFPEGSYLFELTKDRSSIWGNVRFVMIADFFKNAFTSFGNFLFGPSFSAVPTIAERGLNPHNAFIFAYGNYGVFFFLLMPCLIIQAIIGLWKESKAMSFLLLGLTLRGMGDIVAFPGIYDALFYVLAFEMALLPRKRRLKRIKRKTE